MVFAITCAECGGTFAAERTTAETCGTVCRSRRYRAAKDKRLALEVTRAIEVITKQTEALSASRRVEAARPLTR